MRDTSQDEASSEQTNVGVTSPTADPGAIAPPAPPSSSPKAMTTADAVIDGKPLFQKPIFWVGSVAVVVLVVIVAALAASSSHTVKHLAATTTTVSLGSASSTESSGSTTGGASAIGGASATGSGATSSSGKTTKTTQPTQLAVGGTASFSNGGSPVYDLTVTHFADPAQPAEPDVKPKNPGDIFVAVALTFKNTGSAEVSQDIYNDTTLYDSTGRGYDGNFEATASGPGFPVGIVSDAHSGTTSGWIMFEVPASSAGFTATFTPTEGQADQAAATWKLS